MKKKVVILGAGLAGLSTALKLSGKEDLEVVLIEKEDRVGGLARSVEWGGSTVDIGSHAFRTEFNDILEEVKGICGDELSVIGRKSSIWINNGYISYPPKITDLFFKVGLSLNLKFFFDYLSSFFKNIFFRDSKNATFQDWTARRFGTSLSKEFFGDYAEKVWGLPPKLLDAELARRKIAISNLGELLKKLLIRYRGSSFYCSQFYYPNKGIGRIPEAMAKKITACGGRIILNSGINGIDVDGERIASVRYKNHKGVEEATSADFVISTIPLVELVSFLSPKPDSYFLTLSQSLKSRALIMVYLKLKEDLKVGDTWLYFPKKDVLFNRIYNQGKYSRFTVTDAVDILCVEATSEAGGGLWQQTNSDIYKTIVSQLQKIKLIDEPNVKDYLIVREMHAYPIYNVGYKNNLGELLSYLNTFSNLILNGRQGLFNYNNMDHSIKMGFVAADYILSGINRGENWLDRTREFDNYRIVD